MSRTFCAPAISVLVFLCLFSSSLSGHQTSGTPSQALLYLQQSFSKLVGNTSIADVTLTGSVRRIAGSDDETGSSVLKAIAAGVSRVDLSLPSGLRSESTDVSTIAPFGSWSDPDGASHPISFHNLLSEPAWFFPAFAIAHMRSSNYVSMYVGQETKNSQPVYHIAVHQVLPNAVGDTRFFEHLTQLDLYLDSTTLLPAALDFNIHPDSDAGIDVPVEIIYADYRVQNGVQIPFHIQRYLNGSIFLDLQFSAASLNSGLSASVLDVH